MHGSYTEQSSYIERSAEIRISMSDSSYSDFIFAYETWKMEQKGTPTPLDFALFLFKNGVFRLVSSGITGKPEENEQKKDKDGGFRKKNLLSTLNEAFGYESSTSLEDWDILDLKELVEPFEGEEERW